MLADLCCSHYYMHWSNQLICHFVWNTLHCDIQLIVKLCLYLRCLTVRCQIWDSRYFILIHNHKSVLAVCMCGIAEFKISRGRNQLSNWVLFTIIVFSDKCKWSPASIWICKHVPSGLSVYVASARSLNGSVTLGAHLLYKCTRWV